MVNEDKILVSHLSDLIDSVKKGRKYAFSSFLNVEQLSVVYDFLRSADVKYSVFGGFEDAERCIVGFGSDEMPEEYVFPISVIGFSIRQNKQINHRNVLGSLMSLGIKRECLGDIIFKNDMCYVFAEAKIADFLLLNFTSVSSMRIEPVIIDEQIEFEREFEKISVTVSSMRLDCVVSELVNKSRSVSSELITSGLVYLNSIQCQKKDRIIASDDIISVRRIGKFKIDGIQGYTKKNRVKLDILKYI